MFDRILIATDNSPLMKDAIRYTGTLFPYAEYHLINVINTSDGSVPQTNLMESRISDISQEALESGEELLRDMGIDDISKTKPVGTPSKEIIDYIDKENIDLLVMATHSKTGTQRVHIGETALHSLQVTHIPSLIFSCRCASERPKKIFNPTTFSSYSVDATMLAIDLAEMFGASLTTYHIGKENPGASSRRIEKRADKAGVDYELIINKNASDKQILKRSQEHDFIVGSRGRSGLKYKLRFLIHSFSLSSLEKELIAESDIPFLMVGE